MTRNERRSISTAVAVQSSELKKTYLRTSILLLMSGAVIYQLGMVIISML